MRVSVQMPNKKMSTLTVITQYFTALQSARLFMKWIVRMIRRVAPRSGGLQRKNSKLRVLAFSVTDGLVEIITQQPGGCSFWGLLPAKGLNNKLALRKKIASYLLSSFFSDAFLMMLLQSALTVEGRPLENSQLYRWLLSDVYSGDVQRLYSDWLKCKGVHQS
jgi:hypothetical protein